MGKIGRGPAPWSGKERIVDPEVSNLGISFETSWRRQRTQLSPPSLRPLSETLWTAVLKHGRVDFNKLTGAHFYAFNEEEG
jgi:hypothetical protein